MAPGVQADPPQFLRWFRTGVVLLMAVVALHGDALRAQETAGEPLVLPGVIRSAAEIRAMPPQDAQTKQSPALIRGVVTGPSPYMPRVVIQDGETPLLVLVKTMNEVPALGTEVEVAGNTSMVLSQGQPESCLKALVIKQIALNRKVKPLPVTVEDMAAWKWWERWVTVEGVVLQMRLANNDLLIQVAGETGWTTLHVRRWPSADLPLDWHGARIRFEGINLPSDRGSTGFCAAYDDSTVTVLKPGTREPMEAPQTNASALLTDNKSRPDRLRLNAVVTDVDRSGTVYLRDGSMPFRSDPLTPYTLEQGVRVKLGKSVNIPVLHPGDSVELVGSPLVESGSLRMRYAQTKVKGPGGLPEPIEIDAAKAARGEHLNDLITIRGRFMQQISTLLRPGAFYESVRLIEDGGEIEVFLETPDGRRLARMAENDLVEATGILAEASGREPARLRLRQSADVRSLGVAPQVIRSRTIRAVSIGTVVLLAIGGWIALLRRSLRRERQAAAAVTELNTTLEKRVAQRTTELEVAKEELRRSLDQERELNELKSRFVTMVSHEFRTPLGITMSAVELLRHYDDRLPGEKRAELFEDIHRSTRHMGGLMEQVLVLGRVEAGKLGYRPLPLDLDTLARKLIDESLSATNRRCPVEWRPSGDLDGAHGDESLIRHIFGNLISNGVKYSRSDEPVVLSCRREGDFAEFKVKDSGIGIPKEDAARLFEAFHRGSNVGEIPGTGLGLLIVKRCVELHGGTIAVDSEVGRGTTITVRLPLWQEVPAGDEPEPALTA